MLQNIILFLLTKCANINIPKRYRSVAEGFEKIIYHITNKYIISYIANFKAFRNPSINYFI